MSKYRLLAMVISGLLLAGGYVLYQTGNPSSLISGNESTAILPAPNEKKRDRDIKWERERFKNMLTGDEDAGHEPTYFGNDRFNENFKEANAESEADADAGPSQKGPTVSGMQVVFGVLPASNNDGEQTDEPLSVQEEAKRLLGIDAKKVFGVDMDVERNNTRREMSDKTDSQLENMLQSQGIDLEAVRNYLKIRQALREKTRHQPLGVRRHKMTMKEPTLAPVLDPNSQ